MPDTTAHRFTDADKAARNASGPLQGGGADWERRLEELHHTIREPEHDICEGRAAQIQIRSA